MKPIALIKKITKQRPEETKFTLIGGAAGVPVGLAIGGLGVAALGGAVGLPAFAVTAAVGAAIGNRYGISRDRPLDPEETSALGDEVSKKVCPECGHVFQGNGWDGIDAHWRSRHSDVMPYEEAWPKLKAGTYPS